MESSKNETIQVRIREVPVDLRRKIAVHQHLMSVRESRTITLDEACIELLEKAVEQVPALKS